ncbi:MAG: beta-galactosidase [Candidatus Omnitrophota bacterium]
MLKKFIFLIFVATLLFNFYQPAEAAGKSISGWPWGVYGDRINDPNGYVPKGQHFWPGGWMGDTGALTIDEGSPDPCPADGADPWVCTKVTYSGVATNGQNWAGIYWLYPDKNWGTDPDGGWNLSGVTYLSFWAKGQNGGEKINFGVGGVTGTCGDTIQPTVKIPVTLTNTWTQYFINLSGKDGSRVVGGFEFDTSNTLNPNGATFYVDEIYFYNTPMPQPNQPPTATIDSITPNPANQGQAISFTGHGTDTDGSIVAYNWRSSIDSQLSTQASFTSSSLSLGTHTIYFKVQDDDGVWSTEVTGNLTITSPPPAGPYISLKDGYFWDPTKSDYWLPHGIAYQTWNRPLGVWQTPEQIEYDLAEMEKAHVNSIRVDFVWKHIEEKGDNQFDWTNYDMLLEKANAHNIKVFALIGYQWPPDWFPGNPGQEEADPGWYTMHPPGWGPEGDNTFHSRRYTSDIISYEDPQARAQYTEFLSAVVSRYKNDPTIAGWIVGNEYGYLGLWSNRQDGYDPDCENAFRNWLSNYYGGDISKLNSVWGTSYTSFSQVGMPETYHRDNPAWWDLVQWREDSVANFIAIGAKAVKTANPNHLISYATVGMQWGEEDWRYHAEDSAKIAKACRDIGTPLDFWSINNYPWDLLGHESQTGQWGVLYAKWKTGLPVLCTETGFTSSETMYPGLNENNQGILIRNSLWEELETGAIGVHVFHWNDRKYISDREKGFGIVYPDRRVKPAFWVVRDTYNLMDQLDATHLFAGSKDPTADVAFYWTEAVDQMYNRYECNMQQIYGPLERLGLEPTFMNREQLLAGEYTKYKAIILPRNMRMHPGDLNFIRTNVIPAGVHVYADADLPGMQDYHVKPLNDFVSEVKEIFGIDATNASGYDDPVRNEQYGINFVPINVNVTQNLSPLTSGRVDTFRVWKYSNQTVPTTGTVYATHSNGKPALVIKNNGTSKAAITTFSLGDISPDGDGNGSPDIIPWAKHYDWLKAIFLTGFGIQPTLNLTGSQYVLADYRTTKDGSILISFKNYRNDASQTVTLTTSLINGKTVENLTKGGIIETNSDGIISITLAADDHQLLYAYAGAPVKRVRILDIRSTIHPLGNNSYPVKVWYDTQGATYNLDVDFRDSTKVYASADAISVTGAGERELWVFIPDANFADSGYKSTPEGGKYYFEAYLDSSGTKVVQNTHETQLLWGIKPTTLPTSLAQGSTSDININWENLPEYLSWEVTPLFREEAFPGRVLVYKSSKTQAYDSTHYTRFNEVCAWLENLGYQKAELGIWEPAKGYYILTDTDKGTDGRPLDLNWGYLKEFYSTVILPSVYVMNDNECTNLIKYLESGLFTVISTDGSVGFRKPDGTNGRGRIEKIFGAGTGNRYISALKYLTITDNSHYITKDYSNEETISINSSTYARAWTSLTTGKAIATIKNGSRTAPALISNKYGPNGSKAFVFNFGIDRFNQLTDNFKAISQHTDEWSNREIYKIKWQLKYPTTDPNDGDLVVNETEHWTIKGTDSATLTVNLQSQCLTADNLYWLGYVYPWEAFDPWTNQKGFYTSLNDPGYDNIAVSGPGVQIIGTSSYVHAGRSWDVWEAYNTSGATYTLNLVFKEKGDNGDGTSEETYWSMTQSVTGLKEAIQYFGWVPDYNPAYNDYKSSTKGGKYQWSTWFTGVAGTNDIEVKLYFAPRLKVELSTFPKNIKKGKVVSVPIEWENLPQVPAKMKLILQNAYTGAICAQATYRLSRSTGSGRFGITVPSTTPSGSNYLWSAYIYPSTATNPYNERYGLDDTFNYNTSGYPIGPETTITVY